MGIPSGQETHLKFAFRQINETDKCGQGQARENWNWNYQDKHIKLYLYIYNLSKILDRFPKL